MHALPVLLPSWYHTSLFSETNLDVKWKSPWYTIPLRCSSTSSSSLKATAIPPCAYWVLLSVTSCFVTTSTRPASARPIAARSPAMPPPTTMKSVSDAIGGMKKFDGSTRFRVDCSCGRVVLNVRYDESLWRKLQWRRSQRRIRCWWGRERSRTQARRLPSCFPPANRAALWWRLLQFGKLGARSLLRHSKMPSWTSQSWR